jgi:hypothetical protein
MNYIYDVLANFNSSFYDFFDWNVDDDIVHIKKLPILKVSYSFFNKIKYHDVVVSKDLLDKIYHKTDFFKISKNKYNYVCAFCDGNEAIILNFSSDGSVLGRSSFLIDEENEVIDLSECLEVVDYSIIDFKECEYSVFKTRKELFDINYFLSELNKMSEDKLKYLYFECFNEFESDINNVFNRIIGELDNSFSSICDKVSNFLKLTSFNK